MYSVILVIYHYFVYVFVICYRHLWFNVCFLDVALLSLCITIVILMSP